MEITVGSLRTEYDKTDNTDYYSVGAWAAVNMNFSTGGIIGMEFGAIADGPDYGSDAGYVNELSGTASYSGDFYGSYVNLNQYEGMIGSGEYRG